MKTMIHLWSTNETWKTRVGFFLLLALLTFSVGGFQSSVGPNEKVHTECLTQQNFDQDQTTLAFDWFFDCPRSFSTFRCFYPQSWIYYDGFVRQIFKKQGHYLLFLASIDCSYFNKIPSSPSDEAPFFQIG